MSFQQSGFIISVDLGQVNDHTAITVIERIVKPPEWAYGRNTGYGINDEIKECHLRHIERPERGTPYPKIIERVVKLWGSDELIDYYRTVVIDLTGVGRPVWDEMQRTFPRGMMYGVTITGGNEVTKPAPYIFNTPKRDLISSLQVAFQNGDFKIAKGIPNADVLIKELTNFKVKININGHDQYEAWRENIHDDIVLSAAMGVWLAQQRIRLT
jgi:hypothetical protein